MQRNKKPVYGRGNGVVFLKKRRREEATEIPARASLRQSQLALGLKRGSVVLRCDSRDGTANTLTTIEGPGLFVEPWGEIWGLLRISSASLGLGTLVYGVDTECGTE